MGQDSSVKGSLRSFIIIKMIRKGAQSPYDIFKEIKKQNKNEDPESIERSVLREFRNLQLEDKQSQKKIACEYSREVSGNTRYYHNLTDAGIDWHIEKFGLSSEDFWYTAINLFKKNYRFRFAYKTSPITCKISVSFSGNTSDNFSSNLSTTKFEFSTLSPRSSLIMSKFNLSSTLIKSVEIL